MKFYLGLSLSVLVSSSALALVPDPGKIYQLESSPGVLYRDQWRFHRDADGSYRVQSLEDGASWLALDDAEELILNRSDSALNSRWLLEENLAGIRLTNKVVKTKSLEFALREKGDLPLDVEQGDIILFRSMAADKGNIWLDCNTNNGRVGLLPEDRIEASTGTKWRVHENGDGSYSFECLGNVPGRRWLKITGATPGLANTNDRNESTKWRLTRDNQGHFGLENLSYKGRGAATWLDSSPAVGFATLAYNSFESPGTRWMIKVQKKADYKVTGRWSAVEALPFSGIHTHTLPDGRVLSWSRFQDATDQESTIEGVVPGRESTFLFDPVTARVTAVPNADTDTFCSGHSFLPDGRLLVTGGHIRSNVGPKSTQIFDYRTQSWETSPNWDMNAGRWYPTNVTLANGDVLTVSGDATSTQDVNRIPQVWSFREKKWRDLDNLASSCFNDASGPCMPLYPWLHLAPNGKVFVSGPGKETGYIDTEGKGKWEVVAKTNRGYRGDYEATSVQYAPGKIMIAGGIPATNSVEIIDLNAAKPEWKTVNSMHYARHKLTSTILADGSIFVSGGLQTDGNSDDTSVFPSEIWNPETGVWTEADAIRIPRLYHSSAVLLADGRVLSFGGGLGAGYTTHKNFQVYNPPYLFKGPRPLLHYTESTARKFGDTISLETDAAIKKVHLIRLSSDTHSFNSSQTIVPLAFTHKKGKRLQAKLPNDRNIAPPGHYFLFVVNDEGVPSVGQLIQLL